MNQLAVKTGFIYFWAFLLFHSKNKKQHLVCYNLIPQIPDYDFVLSYFYNMSHICAAGGRR